MEGNIKTIAKEENEVYVGRIEGDEEISDCRRTLQLDADQLASLRLKVGKKEQAVAEAETQIAILKQETQSSPWSS
jgi:hypothetical protein